MGAILLSLAAGAGCDRDAGRNDGTGTGGVQASHTARSRWFEGGTLHYASMHEWRYAPYADRLATCADFVVAAMRNRGADENRIDMNAVKNHATELEARITEWASHVDWVVAYAAVGPDGTPRFGLDELSAIAGDPRRPVPQTAAATYVYRSRKKGRAPTASDLDAAAVARTYVTRMALN